MMLGCVGLHIPQNNDMKRYKYEGACTFFVYLADGKAHKFLYAHTISVTKQQGAVVWDIMK